MDDQAIKAEVARDIRYEVHAMWSTALEYASRPRDLFGSDVTIDNALIESCLVHARLLGDFLDVKKSRYEDAALAVHYLASWDSKDTLAKDERKRINWMIMHLSAKRSRVKEGVDLVGTADRVMQVMDRFIGEIIDPDTRRWFEPVLTEHAEFARRRKEIEGLGKSMQIVSTTNEREIGVIGQAQ